MVARQPWHQPRCARSKRGHSSLSHLLSTAGAAVKRERGPEKITPLHAAACNEQGGILRQLVEAGGDLSMRTRDGLPVHHLAILAESTTRVRALVELAADLDIQDHHRTTTLIVCSGLNSKNTEIPNASEKARILLGGGARSDIVGDTLDTTLIMAASYGIHRQCCSCAVGSRSKLG